MPSTDERYRELYNEYYNSEINKSKKTLSEYLDIIKENELSSELKIYDLYTSKKVRLMGIFGLILPELRERGRGPIYPYDNYPIERNSKILVSIPHLTPDYIVLCIP